MASIMSAIKAFPAVDRLCLNAGGLGETKIHEASGATDSIVSNVLGNAMLVDGLIEAKKIKKDGRIVYIGSEVTRAIYSFTGLLPIYTCFGEKDVRPQFAARSRAQC